MIIRAIATLTLLSLACPAFAEEAPRKIDFSKVLIGPDGPFKECRHQDEATGKCTDEVKLTLGRVCIAAAAMSDKGASLVDQTAHGRLALKLVEVISRQGTQEEVLSPDDITFLKAQIAKLGYNTMAVYQAVRMLDPTVDK